MVVIIGSVIVSCEQDNSFVEEISPEVESESLTDRSSWQTIFFDHFNNLSKWEKTNRADYNSETCKYKPWLATTVNIGNNNKALRLKAKKLGYNNFESGHIKSFRKFQPGNNQELSFKCKIKLQAKNNSGNVVPFHDTYGAWPAFWTVEENGWPTKGEIDIMEAYTFGNANKDKYACNMFYGTTPFRSNVSGTLQHYTNKINPTSWNTYEMRWKNKNGYREVNVYINGQHVKKYNNAIIPGLQLQKFTPHNIILNLNVGDSKTRIFDNSKVNLFNHTEMLVDWVQVQKRSL